MMPLIEVFEEPVGQQRHRTARGHEYTPTATLEAQHRIRKAWRESGHGKIEDVVSLDITVYLRRPKHHYGTGRNAHS